MYVIEVRTGRDAAVWRPVRPTGASRPYMWRNRAEAVHWLSGMVADGRYLDFFRIRQLT